MHAFWVAVPGIVNLPLAVVSIYLIQRSRRIPIETTGDQLGDEDSRVLLHHKQGQ